MLFREFIVSTDPRIPPVNITMLLSRHIEETGWSTYPLSYFLKLIQTVV